MSPTKKKSQHNIFFPWIIWLIASLFFFFNYLNQVVPAVMGQNLMNAFNANAVMLGTIAAVYFYAYGIFQIPIGIIDDHYGAHRPLSAAAAIAAIGALIFAFAYNSEQAIFARILIGIGTGFSFVSCLKLVSNWFPAKYFGTLVGLTNIMGMLGAFVGVGVMTKVVNVTGWRNSLLILGYIGIILAVLIFIIVRDHPKQSIPWEESHENNKRGLRKIIADILHIVNSKQFWLAGIYAATINTTYTALGALWGTVFLTKAAHISHTEAGFLSSMIFVGAIPGSLFFGWFSDKIKRRKIPMIFAAATGAVLLGVLLYLPVINLIFAYILLFLLGFFCSGNVIAFTLAHDIKPPGSAGISLGFINLFLIGGSALFQPLIGFLLGCNSVGKIVDITNYNLSDFRYALSSIFIALVIATLSAIFIKETYCKSTV
ncbi:MAG TPA: MFS transporter [Victivallales bacterium]|nr:MFS transporter [Victivallales bacterium]